MIPSRLPPALPYVSTSFSASFAIFYAANQCVHPLPELPILSIISNGDLDHIEYPTLQLSPQFLPHHGKTQKWYNFADVACEAVVPGYIPKSAVTYSTSFEDLLAGLPPTLAANLRLVETPTPVPTRFLKTYANRVYPQPKFGFEHFVKAVEEALTAPGLLEEWGEWIAVQRERKRAGKISPIIAKLLPAVLDALKATLDRASGTHGTRGQERREWVTNKLDRIISYVSPSFKPVALQR